MVLRHASTGVVKAFEDRLAKHFHPAWAAAFVLDPINAAFDADANLWHLPLWYITPAQKKDAIALIARMTRSATKAVSDEWENLTCFGVPPGPASTLANLTATTSQESKDAPDILSAIDKRRGWWIAMSRDTEHAYPLLAKAARILLSAHATTAAAERNWSMWGRHFTSGRSSMKVATAQRLIYVSSNNRPKHAGIDYELNLSVLDDGDE